MMKGTLIFGAGQVAQVMAEQLIDHGLNVRAFVVDDELFYPIEQSHLPTVKMSEVADRFSPAAHEFVTGISFRGLNKVREAKFSAMKSLGYRPFTFVHRSAHVARTARLGEGAYVMECNNIQPGVTIEQNAMLWSANHIGHHSTIREHAWLCSNICVSGAVSVGRRSFLGVNCCIRDNTLIGDDCVVGMGAVVTHDLSDGSLVAAAKSNYRQSDAETLAGIL